MHAAIPRIGIQANIFFPNMKYLKIVVIFTLSIDIFAKNVKINKKIMSFNYKIYNLHNLFS